MDSINYDTISERIWNNATNKKREYKKPFAIFLMGLPASGKSTVIEQFLDEILGLDMTKFIHIDPDIFMERVPDYDAQHAEAFNRFGVILSSKIMKKTLEKKYNYIYYGTGKNYKQYMTSINKSFKLGFHTILINVILEKEVAKSRAIIRSKKAVSSKSPGRRIPISIINNINSQLRKRHMNTKKYKGKTNFEILSSLPTTVDWYVYDNNGEEAVLIDSSK